MVVNMNRKELDERKEELWKDYQSAQVEGYFEDYDFEDFLIFGKLRLSLKTHQKIIDF